MHLKALIDHFEGIAAELRQQGKERIAAHAENAVRGLREKQAADQHWIEMARPEAAEQPDYALLTAAVPGR